MLFYKVKEKAVAFVVQGSKEKELKLRILALIIWLAATIILVVLAIVAYCKGWPEGAKQILTVAGSVVGSGGLGIILGERRTAKEAGLAQ